MMTDDDRARLELAQRAWQIASASDQEVEAGVHRVNRRLRLRTHSRSHSRHVLTLVPAAFALFAALAYGQTGGFEHPPAFATRWFGGQPGKSLETGLRPPAVDRAARGLGQDYIKHGPAAPEPSSAAPVDPSDLPTDSTAVHPDSSEVQEAVPVKPERKQRQRARKSVDENTRPSGEQTAGSSWRQVDRALAAGDERGARRALQKIAKDESNDATTQAKAKLGLAQLALSRDDCKRAAAIAEGVARTEGIDERVVKRAHDIVLKCD
jgi:hypothetical protein